MKCLKKWYHSLPEEIVVKRHEILLTIAVGVLGGILFGIFFSPKKHVEIGSNNGNNCHDNCGTISNESNEDEDEE